VSAYDVQASSAAGPLKVSKKNPRYLTVAAEADRKAVYLILLRDFERLRDFG
jgi:hypothetical protein